MGTINLGQTVRSEFENTTIQGKNVDLVCTLFALEYGKIAQISGAVIDKKSNQSIGSVKYNNGEPRNGDGYSCEVGIHAKEFRHLQMEVTELLMSAIEQLESAPEPAS